MSELDQSVIQDDIHYMQVALDEARQAARIGEVPIGACVVYEGRIIARAHNRRETDKSPSAHAEFLAMQQAARVLDRWRLSGCSVYVSLEPCIMCTGLMINSRVDRCVYGCPDPKGGAVGTLFSLQSDERLNHEFSVTGGVLEDDCGQILKDFFARRRKERKAQKQEGIFVKPKAEELSVLDQTREQINCIDEQIFNLFDQRLDACSDVASYKLEHNLNVLDHTREQKKLEWARNMGDSDREDFNEELMQDIMDISKRYQEKLIQNKNNE